MRFFCRSIYDDIFVINQFLFILNLRISASWSQSFFYPNKCVRDTLKVYGVFRVIANPFLHH